MRIFLVRHGESQANVDQNLHKTLPDHEIALSTRGTGQPKQAAKHFETFVKNFPERFELPIPGVPNSDEIMLWNSPYRRTRDTADLLADNLEKKDFKLVRRENILLCEQQFGLFDGLSDEEIEAQYPNEYKTWMLCKQYNGKFWARYPMGESPFDAAVRIRQSFEDIKRTNFENHIIVCHGTVVKLFVMMWFNYSPEWFSEALTIGNCGIYFIEDDTDRGWIFNGYKRGKIAEFYSKDKKAS